jgi:hypothetical protein
MVKSQPVALQVTLPIRIRITVTFDINDAWVRRVLELQDDEGTQHRAGVRTSRPATTDDESGRGLELVAALCADWGWEPLPDGRKRVWALLAP